jgi:hypothetical protein
MLALNRSILKTEWTNKCSEGLGFDHLCVQSPYNPLAEDYTQVFYMIPEGDVPSVRCEVKLRWSKSMRDADGPSQEPASPVFRLEE